MIVDCVACLHGHYPELEGGDLLVVAGDLTANDKVKSWVAFYEWLNGQKYTKKVYIGGNHDNFLTQCCNNVDPIQVYVNCDPSTEYLCDSGTEFEGLKIWGSPWTKRFSGMNPKCKAFTVDTEEELADKFSTIPVNIDILVTHSPPEGIGDLIGYSINNSQLHVGSNYLKGALEYVFRPKLWVFGHIHEGYGIYRYKFEEGEELPDNGTWCVNASHMDQRYRPVNKPIRIVL